MKKAPLLFAIALLLLAAGCNVRNNPPVRPLVQSPQVTASPAAGNPTKSVATVAPGKTASQDTAGANSPLPEAATAPGVTSTPE